MIMDSYLTDHTTRPSTFSALLDHRYFVNDDCIARAAALIQAGQCGDFEMSVDPGKMVLNIDFTRMNGVPSNTSYVYEIGLNGYDMSTSEHRRQVIDEGSGTRIVLVNKTMLSNPDSWLGAEDHKPLSSFYQH
jgi:hypothetical protein